MKKFFTVAAVLLILTMTACGDNGGTEETETTVSAADATTTTAETTAATSGTTAAETESRTEASTESADAENIFRGTGYTLTIDSADWEDNTEQFAELSSYLNAVFVHTNEGKANFNIVMGEVGDPGEDFDMRLLEPALKEAFSEENGFTYLGGEVVQVNGCDAFKITYEEEYNGSVLKREQYTFIEGTFKYVITYTTAKENYDVFLPDFEAAVQSIEFEK